MKFKLREVDKENLKHPMTWVFIGGMTFWILLAIQAIILPYGTDHGTRTQPVSYSRASVVR